MTPPLDRPTAVLLLLDSLLDYLPTVKSATGQLAASGGSAVGTVKTCPRCDGSGVEIVERWDDGHRRQVACGECRGERTVEAKRGESGSDPMIDRSAKGLSAIKGRGMERSELDAEIASLERSRRDRAGERSSRDAYGWERERVRQAKAGSYRELEAALEWLRDAAPGRCKLAWRVAYHEPWLLDDAMLDALGETLELLAARMPARIRVPDRLLARQVASEAGGRLDPAVRAVRDREIRDARALGVPVAQLAVRYGISGPRVSQIVATTMGG